MLSRLRKAPAAVLAAFLAAFFSASVQAAQIKARAWVQRGIAERRLRIQGVSQPDPLLPVLVELAPGVSIDDIRAAYPRGHWHWASGPIATAKIPASLLSVLDADKRIISIDSPRNLHPTLDVIRSNSISGGLYLGVTRNAASADLANATGSGTIVGVVDTGIDFRHKDFIDPVSGHSRLLYLWDQTVPGGASPSVTGFSCTNTVSENDCGSEWTNAQLNASLPSGGPVSEVDSSGHGTHVAGIAAGNGQGNGNGAIAAGTFVGMAPKADIIFVKTDFSPIGIIDGVKYIAARANALHERAVINLSLGGEIDPHDGSSSLDVAIAAVAASTPVAVAMGNDGTGAGSAPHARFSSLGFGQSVTFSATINPSATGKDVEVDFWGSTADSYAITGVTLAGRSCSTMSEPSGSGTDSNAGSFPFSCAGNSVSIDNASLGTGSSNSSNREMYIDIHNSSFVNETGVNVTVQCTRAAGCGVLDGFVDPAGESANFVAGSGYTLPQTLTVASPATANNVIAVASYASKTFWNSLYPGDCGGTCSYAGHSTLGMISNFSGWGPTRDGRSKPDVAAPGEAVASTLSSNSPADFTGSQRFQVLTDNAHGILQGTSMAAPVVAGILAARLQGLATRTVSDLRAIITGLARADDSAFTSLGGNAQYAFGAGKVMGSPQPVAAPSGLSAAPLSANSILWNWTGGVLSADAYDLFYASNTSQKVIAAQSPPYIQTGLLPNATFAIEIAGEGGGIDGPLSATISTATLALAPSAAPSVMPWTSSATVVYSTCPIVASTFSCSGYIAQVSGVSDFSTLLFSSETFNTALGTLTISGVSPNTGYFVRVAALNQLGALSYSPSSSFATNVQLFAPNSPSFDQISTGTIRFSWGGNGNPSPWNYIAQASTAPDYSGNLLTLVVPTLNAAFGGLSADTSYYFRVQPVGGPLLSVANPTATLALSPGAAALTFPVLGTSALTVNWANNGDQNDTLYQTDISSSPTFIFTLISSQTRTLSASFSGLAVNTPYYARVAAISRSATFSSATVLGSTATWALAPTVSGQPFSGQTQSGFTFSFSGGANPSGTLYRAEISTDPFFSFVRASSDTAGSSAAFSGLTSDQIYYAQVAALNLVGNITSFTAIAATATAVATPVALASPISTRSATSIGFSWSPGILAAGTTYQAQISSSPSFAFNVQSAVTLNTTTTFLALQPNTTYFGQVQALSLYPPTPNGAFLSPAAVIATLPNPPGAAAAPFSNVFITSLTFNWAPLALAPSSAAAEGYRADVSRFPDFSSLFYTTTVGTSVSSITVGSLTYGTTYYARVASLGWDGAANYASAVSTITNPPPLSSGTITSGALTLNLPANGPVLGISVNVPGGAFVSGTPISAIPGFFNTGLTTLVGAASNETGGGIVPLGDQAAFCVSAAPTCLSGAGVQPAFPVRLSMTYDPAQIPAGVDESRLQFMRYDPTYNQWILVPSQDDPVNHLLTGFTAHFTLFAPFFVNPGIDLGAIQVFPQPWELGDASSDFWSNVLTFANLPAGADLKILTITGELVWEGYAAANGVLTWNGLSRFGRRVASGTYYASFKSGGQRKLRRVVLIR